MRKFMEGFFSSQKSKHEQIEIMMGIRHNEIRSKAQIEGA